MYKKLIVFLFAASISSSVSAFDLFASIGASIDGAINTISNTFSDDQPQGNNSSITYTLTIDSNPPNSTIKILNITPKYSNGIELKPGQYDILVQKKGYTPHRKKITISNSNIRVKVNLTKIGTSRITQINNGGAVIVSKKKSAGKPTPQNIEGNLYPNFDIVGLKLGMPAKEARAAIHRYNPDLNIKELSDSINDIPNSDYISQLSTKQPGYTGKYITERIGILFYMPPNENSAAAITRYVKYDEKSRPTIKDTKAALIQKYGKAAKPTKLVNNNLEYIWKYAVDGAPTNNKACGGSINTVEKTSFTASHAACGLYLRVFIKTDGQHVNSIAARLYNKGQLARNADNTHEYVLNYKNDKYETKKLAEATPSAPIF
ncbi:PEGA domain-containing protein [Pseudomonadota bacterium]